MGKVRKLKEEFELDISRLERRRRGELTDITQKLLSEKVGTEKALKRIQANRMKRRWAQREIDKLNYILKKVGSGRWRGGEKRAEKIRKRISELEAYLEYLDNEDAFLLSKR